MITKNRQNQREVIEQYLQPGTNGFREQLKANGKQVKNHMKQHRESLQKTAEANWKKKEEAQAAPKDAFKMRQFKNV